MHQYSTCKYIRQSDTKIKGSSKALFILTLILLCLMAMDFKTKIYSFAIVAFCLTIYIRADGFIIPAAVFPAFLLMASIILFSPGGKDNIMDIIRPMVYPLCIITGYNIVEAETVQKTEKQVFWVILTLAIGSYSHFFINMLINWGRAIDRNTIDIWTRSILNATGQSTMAVVMIGVTESALFSPIKIHVKLLAVAGLLSIIFFNLLLGGRTILVLSALLFSVNLLISWFSRKESNKRIRGIMLIIIIFLILLIIIHNNIFGIKDIFFNSTLYQRFMGKTSMEELSEDGRMRYKIVYLKNMLKYPFGGNALRKAVGGFYAHDIILDTYSQSGIFACAAILTMLTDMIIKCIKICINKKIDRWRKSIVLNVIFAILCVFMIEPILQGMPWLFASYCVIYGSITKMTEAYNTEYDAYIKKYNKSERFIRQYSDIKQTGHLK